MNSPFTEMRYCARRGWYRDVALHVVFLPVTLPLWAGWTLADRRGWRR